MERAAWLVSKRKFWLKHYHLHLQYTIFIHCNSLLVADRAAVVVAQRCRCTKNAEIELQMWQIRFEWIPWLPIIRSSSLDYIKWQSQNWVHFTRFEMKVYIIRPFFFFFSFCISCDNKQRIEKAKVSNTVTA